MAKFSSHMNRVRQIRNRRMAKALFRKIYEVEGKLERANLAEFLQLLERPLRLLGLNFIAGLARGFGIAIGLTIIASLFIVILSALAKLNLPIIGKYIADLVRIVNQQLRLYS